MSYPTWRDDGDHGWTPIPSPLRRLRQLLQSRRNRRWQRYVTTITDRAREDQALRIAHGEGADAPTTHTPVRWTVRP